MLAFFYQELKYKVKNSTSKIKESCDGKIGLN